MDNDERGFVKGSASPKCLCGHFESCFVQQIDAGLIDFRI